MKKNAWTLVHYDWGDVAFSGVVPCFVQFK